MSACPTGCGHGVRPGHLLCRLCWRLVPANLQADVVRTWREFQHAGLENIGTRRIAYGRAAEMATHAARERQIQRELRA